MHYIAQAGARRTHRIGCSCSASKYRVREPSACVRVGTGTTDDSDGSMGPAGAYGDLGAGAAAACNWLANATCA
jgi:hypothetical protein